MRRLLQNKVSCYEAGKVFYTSVNIAAHSTHIPTLQVVRTMQMTFPYEICFLAYWVKVIYAANQPFHWLEEEDPFTDLDMCSQ